MASIKLKLVILSVVAGILLQSPGCGGTAGPDPDTGSVTASLTPAVTVTRTTVSPAPTTKLTTESVTSWVMPNLVGQNLQAAQNTIQELTADAVFFTSSVDATGQGRAQVVDANWKVCAQNVKPGDIITANTKIEFAAVKLTERCP